MPAETLTAPPWNGPTPPGAGEAVTTKPLSPVSMLPNRSSSAIIGVPSGCPTTPDADGWIWMTSLLAKVAETVTRPEIASDSPTASKAIDMVSALSSRIDEKVATPLSSVALV